MFKVRLQWVVVFSVLIEYTFAKYVAFAVITAVHWTEKFLASRAVKAELMVGFSSGAHFFRCVDRFCASCAFVALATDDHWSWDRRYAQSLVLVIIGRVYMSTFCIGRLEISYLWRFKWNLLKFRNGLNLTQIMQLRFFYFCVLLK